MSTDKAPEALPVLVSASFGWKGPCPGAYRCRGVPGATCSESLPYPGLCDACGRTLFPAKTEMSAAERSIPPLFRWATLDAPEMRQLVLGYNELWRRLGGNSAAIAAFIWQAAHTVVIRTPGRRGKTALACALMRHAVDAGAVAARFVDTRMLKPPSDEPSEMRLALEAPLLVLDDVGSEASARGGDDFRTSDRLQATAHVIARRLNREAKTILTTPLYREQMTRLYGDGIAGRCFERTPMINVVDLEKLAT